VIEKYGAEVLRLWVSATDYRDDVRISENMMKQLSDAYRRIRNTCRFLLGNLADFDPETNQVAPAAMTEIDRYALHLLGRLIQRCKKAYDDYEFHIVYHSIFHFCVVDLSAFYLDILKDRLYVTVAENPERRSAQTVMYQILTALVRLIAPILPFTADEIWEHMPQSETRPESVHLALFPEAASEWNDPELAKRWETLRAVRGQVTKALETRRSEKRIGHSLDAAVTLRVENDLHGILTPFEPMLREIFIVSEAALATPDSGAGEFMPTELPGLFLSVRKTENPKCERCWVKSETVGRFPDHPGICERCRQTLVDTSGSAA
jgi:isoleucyl-tRNA synthetase